MKLASLDLFVASAQVQALSFLEPVSLADYDAVLWSPRGFLRNLGDRIERFDPNVLSTTASDELLRISRHWRREFDRLLKRDGTLVILAEPPSSVSIHTLQEIISYESLEPLAGELQVKPVSYAASDSLAPFIHTGEPFRSLFDDIEEMMLPEVHLEYWPGIPVLFDAASKPVSAYVSVVPGRVLWLPSLDNTILSEPQGADRLAHALGRCLDRLGFMSGVSYAPWLSGYVTTQEGRAVSERQHLLRERASIDDKIRHCDAIIGEIEFYKQVVGGAGHGARLSVAESFRRHGYVVQHDWLKEQILIVEDEGDWVVAYVLFDGDDTGPGLWKQLHDALSRVRTYFNHQALPLLVDCTQNGKPFSQRTQPGPFTSLGQQKGVVVVESPALYGWLNTQEPLCMLANLGTQGDKLRQHLYQIGVRSLTSLVDAAVS